MGRLGDILIAGGYGEVGSRIAEYLASDFPGRVIVAGRNPRRGAALCHRLDGAARTRRIDVRDSVTTEQALDGVSVVVSCIDQPDRRLLLAALSRGLAYTDITPHLTRWPNSKDLDAEARRTGARIVLAAGLCPGISSVMARAAADRVGSARTVQTSIFLSIGDRFGPASLRYLFDEISERFTSVVDGQPRSLRAFENHVVVDFGSPVGRRTAYAFPFSDQTFYPRTLGARTAASRLAVDPPWLGRLASRLSRVGAASRKGSALQIVAASAVRLLARAYSTAGRNLFAVLVEVEGKERRSSARLNGRVQADATAVGAAEIARLLDDGDIAPGAWLPEEVISPTGFLMRLEGRGLRVAFSEALAGPAPAVSSDGLRSVPETGA